MKKIKVLHIVGEMGFGGYENFIMNIFRNIDKERFEFHFLVFRERLSYFEEEINSLGGKVWHTSFADDKNLLKFRRILSNILEKEKIDIAHCHNRYYAPVYYPVLKKHNVKIISHSHIANFEKTLKGRIVNYFGRYLNNKTTYRLACSYIAGKFVFGDKSFDVFPNCIDVSRFSFKQEQKEKMRKKYCIAEDEIVLGHIGRFAPQKNHKFLLELTEKLINEGVKFKLFMCGNGVLKDEVVSFVDSNKKLSPYICFLESGDTSYYYSFFDVFVFPSLFEGFPLTLLEAQAAGCFVLASSTITNEVLLTKNINYLDIQNIDTWVNEIVNFRLLTANQRMEDNLVVANSRFNSIGSSKEMAKYYEWITQYE